MITNRLKKIIFKKLYKDLSKAEIIPYQESIWFIDREKKYWYLEYNKNGDLWWRYPFFDYFFSVFSLDMEEYETLVCEWAEEVLNCKVIEPESLRGEFPDVVEDVLNCKVTTPLSRHWIINPKVEEVLNHKVNVMKKYPHHQETQVQEVLNSVLNLIHDKR